MPEMVPAALFSRAAAGEIEAFERLLAPAVESSYMVALCLLEDPALAEQAVAAACRTAFRRLRACADYRQLRLWFVSIVRAECQRRVSQARPPLVAVGDDPATTQELSEAIGNLDFQARSLIVLRYYLRLSIEEVAQVEGITPAVASDRLARAAQSLGPLFNERHGLPESEDLIFARRMQRLYSEVGGPSSDLRPRIERALRRPRAFTQSAALVALAILAAVVLVAASLPHIPGWIRVLGAHAQGPSSSARPLAMHTGGGVAAGSQGPGATVETGSAAGPAPQAYAGPAYAGPAAAPQPLVPGQLGLAGPALPAAEVGLAFGPVAFSASGGSPPYQWSVAPAAPTGLSLAVDGARARLQGTPTQPASVALTLTVTDARGVSQSRISQLNVAAGLALSDTPAPAAEVGVAYSAIYTASSGVAPYTWSVTSGVAGVTAIASGAVVRFSGTPTAAGQQTLRIGLSDALGASVQRTYTVGVALPLQVASTLPGGIHGKPYSFQLVSGGVSGYQASGLPAWLTLTPSGALTGALPAPATYSFTAVVTDSCSGCRGSVTRSLTLISS
jgi:DNA-directed RNA polymerase specialized sigma24 family protein